MSVFSLDKGTKPEVGKILERLLAQRVRCRIWYGDAETGRAWPEEHDVLGTIGRSTGPKKAALLLPNADSMGGGAILTACIVRIDTTWDHQTLYKHPTFHTKFERARVGTTPPDREHHKTHPWSVVNDDGEYVAAFKNERQATRWIAFMRGERYAK